MIPAQRILSLLIGSAVATSAAVDSSEILFQEGTVRTYSLDFYGDTAWNSKLEAMWKADSGYLPARFFDGQATIDSVGVRFKGNSSFTLAGNNPKKPIKIKFNEFKSQSYYGIKVLNFSNGIGDPTLMRERIGYAIARKVLPSPRASYAQLAVEGRSLGLYTQVEQADKSFLKRWYPDAKGDLYKAGDDGADLVWKGSGRAVYEESGDYELKTNENTGDWSGFVRFLDFLNNSTDSVFCAGRRAYVDDSNVAYFLAFNTALSHFDSYNGSGRNWYLYQPDSGSAMSSMIPWDLNLAFGAYGGASTAISSGIDTIQAPISERPLFRRFLSCPDGRSAYLAALRDLATRHASTDSVEAAVVRDSILIQAFVEADSHKFYSTSAWKTSLRANVRGSEGLVLGLVSFSKSRNAEILKQLDAKTGIASGPKLFAPRLVRRGGSWAIDGVPAGRDVEIRWVGLDGRASGRILARSGGNCPTFELPSGAVVVTLSTGRDSRTSIVLNHRKRTTP